MKRSHRALALAAALGIASLLPACRDSGTGTGKGGDFVVSLDSPAGAEGAAVIELDAAGIEEVAAVDGELFSERSGDVLRAVVVRDEPGPIRFRVRVAPDRTAPAGRVVEVADGADQLRASLQGYRLRVERP